MKSPIPAQYSDAEFTALPLEERAILIASTQVGVEEVPRGSNWGPMVKLYLKAAGILSPAFWCAAFVYWCYVSAGCPRKLLWKNPASTLSMYEWAVKTGRLISHPVPRGLFVYWSPGGGHTGFVPGAEPASNSFRTIEGNTNDGGSRNGYKVARRTRVESQVASHTKFGYIDMRGLIK